MRVYPPPLIRYCVRFPGSYSPLLYVRDAPKRLSLRAHSRVSMSRSSRAARPPIAVRSSGNRRCTVTARPKIFRRPTTGMSRPFFASSALAAVASPRNGASSEARLGRLRRYRPRAPRRRIVAQWPCTGSSRRPWTYRDTAKQTKQNIRYCRRITTTYIYIYIYTFDIYENIEKINK